MCLASERPLEVSQPGKQFTVDSYARVATSQGKVRVREKSGNFEKSQGNLEFLRKSGKFAIGQGNLEVL